MEDVVTEVNRYIGEAILVGLGGGIKLPGEEDFTFQRITGGRAIGEIDNTSHYRSGFPNTWRNELPPDIVSYIRSDFRFLLERYYPDALE